MDDKIREKIKCLLTLFSLPPHTYSDLPEPLCFSGSAMLFPVLGMLIVQPLPPAPCFSPFPIGLSHLGHPPPGSLHGFPPLCKHQSKHLSHGLLFGLHKRPRILWWQRPLLLFFISQHLVKALKKICTKWMKIYWKIKSFLEIKGKNV